MGDTTGILDSQNVKAGHALRNCLHQITPHRDEGYEAQIGTWQELPTGLPLCVAVLYSLPVFSFLLGFIDHFPDKSSYAIIFHSGEI